MMIPILKLRESFVRRGSRPLASVRPTVGSRGSTRLLDYPGLLPRLDHRRISIRRYHLFQSTNRLVLCAPQPGDLPMARKNLVRSLLRGREVLDRPPAGRRPHPNEHALHLVRSERAQDRGVSFGNCRLRRRRRHSAGPIHSHAPWFRHARWRNASGSRGVGRHGNDGRHRGRRDDNRRARGRLLCARRLWPLRGLLASVGRSGLENVLLAVESEAVAAVACRAGVATRRQGRRNNARHTLPGRRHAACCRLGCRRLRRRRHERGRNGRGRHAAALRLAAGDAGTAAGEIAAKPAENERITQEAGTAIQHHRGPIGNHQVGGGQRRRRNW